MQGTSIKITGPDGQAWRVPFAGAQMSIGRTPDNAIVLEQGGVSSHHCVIGRDPTGAFLIQDQGSTNGTWIGEQRIAGMVPLHPGVAVMVGSYMLMLETGTGAVKPLTAVGVARPGGLGSGLGARPIGVGTAGPLIRKSDDEHRDRQFHDRVGRYAAEWDKNGRPGRLLLRGRNLAQALELLESDGDLDLRFGELEESFIRASKEGRERNKVVRRVGIAAGSIALIGVIAVLVSYDFEDDEAVAETEVVEQAEAKKADDKNATEEVKAIVDPSGGDDSEKATIEHTVIPAETVEEIALRYDVSIQAVMRWNGIDESPVASSRSTRARPRSRSSSSPIGPTSASRGRAWPSASTCRSRSCRPTTPTSPTT
jgi:hypothetical protein